MTSTTSASLSTRRDTIAAYTGTATHTRATPSRSFAPKLFLVCADVDALPGVLDPLPMWSGRRAAAVRYRRRDFFDGADTPLADGVRDLVADRLGWRPVGRVRLLAHFRTFGWLFNPLAVYYCWDAEDRSLEAIVLEVSNTPWGERTWYVFDARDGATSGTAAKSMHVSPLLPSDVEYHVRWTLPNDDVSLVVEVRRGTVELFRAELALQRVTLDRRSAIALPARYPMLPLRVSIRIHVEAFRTWWAGARFVPHPRRTGAQS